MKINVWCNENAIANGIKYSKSWYAQEKRKIIKQSAWMLKLAPLAFAQYLRYGATVFL